MKILQFVFAGFLCVAWMALALAGEGDYQSAIALGRYTETDRDSDYTAYVLGYSYYLHEVQTDGVPVEEAAYLKRVSRINVNYIKTEYKSPIYLDSEGQRYTLSYDSRHPDSDFSYYLYYYNNDTDYAGSSGAHVGSINYKRYTVSGGYYIAKNTSLDVEYTRYEKQSSQFTLSYASSDTYTVSVKHVILNSDQSAWNFFASISIENFSNGEDNHSEWLHTDYYFSPLYSLGGGIESTNGSRLENNGIYLQINGTAYLTPLFFMSLELAQFKADNTVVGYDEDITYISAGLHF